ncbi:MAG: hypothetical protein O7E57_18325 [Gammaproteobacteria bacterium]|nr:hypothetical protein [Gammaproteobacteria bacterium]
MIELDTEVRRRLAHAIDDEKTLTAAYVDVEGKPHISFYGSTHVHERDQLAIWVRNPKGALLQTLPERPDIVFIYGDISSQVYYTFAGRGRVAGTDLERDRVYHEMHAIERKFDPDKKGVAVLVDLDKVTILSAAAGKQEFDRND